MAARVVQGMRCAVGGAMGGGGCDWGLFGGVSASVWALSCCGDWGLFGGVSAFVWALSCCGAWGLFGGVSAFVWALSGGVCA